MIGKFHKAGEEGITCRHLSKAFGERSLSMDTSGVNLVLIKSELICQRRNALLFTGYKNLAEKASTCMIKQ